MSNDREADTHGPGLTNYIIDVAGILESLHASGVAAKIYWDGPGAIELKLGHATAGIVATTHPADEIFSVAEAALWLRERACRYFPDSPFAWRYRNRVERPGATNTPGTRGARLLGCTCPTTPRRADNFYYLVDPKCPAHGFI